MNVIITGGRLSVDQKVFAKEMLIAGSLLKKLMNGTNGPKRKPEITKDPIAGVVQIDFNPSEGIILDENYTELCKQIREQFAGKIEGSIVVKLDTLISLVSTIQF